MTLVDTFSVNVLILHFDCVKMCTPCPTCPVSSKSERETTINQNIASFTLKMSEELFGERFIC